MDPTQGGAKSVGLPTARWHVRCGRPLGSRCLQIADADQVVRRRREGDDPVDECAPAMPHLPQAADRLHPPKDLLRYHLERRIARNRSDDAFVQAFPAETTEAFCAGHTRFRQGNPLHSATSLEALDEAEATWSTDVCAHTPHT